MLNFAAFCPHPPVIIPQIGKNDSRHVEKTRLAMQALGQKFAQAAPEKTILISPHTLLLHNRFAISGASEILGGLGGENTQGPDIILSFNGEKELGQIIHRHTQNKQLFVQPVSEENDTFPLSHGEMVPLFFLSQEHNSFDLLVGGYSNCSLEKHFQYGRAIGEILQNYPHPVAFVSSGDLSHRLSPASPKDFSPIAAEFDRKILQYIKKNAIDKIITMDKRTIEDADECGLRSLVILLGVLSCFKYEADIMSYEAPFGVGYSVINFEIK